MLKIACLLALVGLSAAQLFGGLLGSGGEHAELGSFRFWYDPTSHYLVGRSHSNCYFMGLDSTAQHDVHTGTGLEHAELQMITMIAGGEDELTTDQLVQHSRIIDLICRNHKLYHVGMAASMPPMTTFV